MHSNFISNIRIANWWHSRNSKHTKLHIQMAHKRKPTGRRCYWLAKYARRWMCVCAIGIEMGRIVCTLELKLCEFCELHSIHIAFCVRNYVFSVVVLVAFVSASSSLTPSQLSIKFNKNLQSISYSIFRFNIYSRKCAIIFCSNWWKWVMCAS